MPQGKEKPLVNFYEKMEEKYMLKVEKNISLSGQSVVNGIMVESYNASISAENPENTYIRTLQIRRCIKKTAYSAVKTAMNLKRLFINFRMK